MIALARIGVLLGVLMITLGSWQRAKLPPPIQLREETRADPAQTAAQSAPFETQVGGVLYTVKPLYDYDIAGLVVSGHDSHTWWDSIHKEWNDHLNAVDLCVIYGSNAQSGAYLGLRYSSGQFVCYFRADSDAAWRAFDPRALSNNHLLTDDARVAKVLRSVRVGDQVRIRGWLAEYSHRHNGQNFGRGTSITRDDTGNGACETIFVKDVQVLRKGGAHWPLAVHAGIVLLLVSLVGWLIAPPKLDGD